MVMYKRRHYYAPVPTSVSAIRNNKAGTGTGPASNFYRKRFAYTELKDMNND